MEFRIKDCQLQADDAGSLKVGGYINVTERESEMLYNKRSGKWFKEIMRKGVFKKAIEKAERNIPLLFEHDWNKQLASIEEGSLTLKEDNIGLRFDAVINDESIYQQVKAGIINSCSFGFRALAEEVEAINSKLEKRIVSAIDLMEVSLVKNPAYVGSLCETRSYEEELEKEEREKNNADDELKETETKQDADIEKAQDEDIKEDEQEAQEAQDTQEEEVSEEKETDTRFNESESDSEVVATEINKEVLASMLDELIEAKLQEINKAQEVETAMVQQTEEMKEFHKELEKENEINTMVQSSEVLRLRVELLKLKEIKRGI